MASFAQFFLSKRIVVVVVVVVGLGVGEGGHSLPTKPNRFSIFVFVLSMFVLHQNSPGSDAWLLELADTFHFSYDLCLHIALADMCGDSP